MPTALIVIIAIIVVLAIMIIGSYNGLVKLTERVKEAWSDITVQLKYRADLIPNLVETVKGYAKHEDEVFSKVTEARKQTLAAQNDPKAAAVAEKEMQGAIRSIYAVAENYPDLKASSNFQELQSQLQEVEDKIQSARRFYNAGAQSLNTKLKTFPTIIFNKLFFHFKEREYFAVDEAEKAKIEKAPEVKF